VPWVGIDRQLVGGREVVAIDLDRRDPTDREAADPDLVAGPDVQASSLEVGGHRERRRSVVGEEHRQRSDDEDRTRQPGGEHPQEARRRHPENRIVSEVPQKR
jgi:hypothetical protein